MIEAFTNLEKAAKDMNLFINQEKTKYMPVTKKSHANYRHHLEVRSYTFQLTWWKRYNYELYEIFEPNIVNYIKVKRLAWTGHLVRINDRTLKKIFGTKPDGVRNDGRPKLRWEDGVDQDMRILEVKNWKKVALNRDKWTWLLKKAEAHRGL
jgi:hypothetical protein